MGFVRGESRSQWALFPVSLDELVPEDHLVRVIDLWVDRVDVGRLGFAKAQPKGVGRPPYDPGDLLKLYLYGYLNQLRSSRKLERKCPLPAALTRSGQRRNGIGFPSLQLPER